MKNRRIFPLYLGMKDSGYTHAQSVLPHRASGYERTPSGLQNARCYDMSIPFAAGAVYSTVGDLLLWDQALYGERLLPARLRDLLFKPNRESYGYGWVMLVPEAGTPYAGESIPMHGGAIFGYQSVIQHIQNTTSGLFYWATRIVPSCTTSPWRSGRFWPRTRDRFLAP